MDEWSIVQFQEMMTNGSMTAKKAVQFYLDRIEQIDRQGPGLNSILAINPEALAVAEQLDAERQANGPRGALHGIPILLKDNIATRDPLPTTAGSLALAHNFATQDSFVAERLRAAGAIILGKTNLSEWANFRSNRSSSGWSSAGGQVRNPYALDRNPCGSSSGSAVAVAANLCAAAIGTETDGSIVCPAHVNGIVGLKPTVGLIGRSGIVPISHSQDTAGPMARTVTGAVTLLGAMIGSDERDPAMSENSDNFYIDYTQFLDIHGLEGKRIGIARNYFGANPRVDELIEGCLAVIIESGADVVDPVEVVIPKELQDLELQLLHYEFKAGLNEYLDALGPAAQVHSLAEVITYNVNNRENVMPHFGQEHMLQAQAMGPLTEDAYLNIKADCRRLSRNEGIDATMAKHNLDAIVAPTGGPAWITDFINKDHYTGSCSMMPAVAGYPHITVPAGLVSGLPVGISFVASAYQEPTLIRIAYAFEQATNYRRPPRYVESI